MSYINITNFALISYLEKDRSMIYKLLFYLFQKLTEIGWFIHEYLGFFFISTANTFSRKILLYDSYDSFAFHIFLNFQWFFPKTALFILKNECLSFN